MNEENLKAVDFYGQALLLHFTISEFADEMNVDVCQSNPRMVCMAVTELRTRTKMLTEAMASAIALTLDAGKDADQ